MTMRRFFSLLFLCLIMSQETQAELEFHAKFDFGNRWGTDWKPLYGGQLSVEFILLRYFGLEAGLKANTFMTDVNDAPESFESRYLRAITFGPRIAPKFLLPFDISAVSLVPYAVLALDLPLVSVVENKIGIGFGAEAGLGLKLLFGNVGALVEWGSEFLSRKTGPSFIFFPQRISAGLVIKF